MKMSFVFLPDLSIAKSSFLLSPLPFKGRGSGRGVNKKNLLALSIILLIGGESSANRPLSLDRWRESPVLPIISFFPNGAPSESALFSSIGFFFFFLNTGRG